ncbi:MAG: helix-turn-helix domain-containing protein [Bradymonadaceae bacterium]
MTAPDNAPDPSDLPFTPLRELFRRARHERGLTSDEVIDEVDLPADEAETRLRWIESGKELFVDDETLERFDDVLEIGLDRMQRAIEREFEWLDEKTHEPTLIVRVAPAIYSPKELPDDLEGRDEMLEYALDFSEEIGRRACLSLSKVRGIYVEPDGSWQERRGLPTSDISLEFEFDEPDGYAD